MKNALVLCVSVFIGLLIVEVGLRLFDPLDFQPHASRDLANVSLVNQQHYFCKGGPQHIEPHPVTNSRDTPNQSYFEFRNDIVSFIDLNEHGFRGAFDDADASKRVIVLGDSFIRGTLSDETEAIPALLSQWSRDTHFVNLGTGGHGTLQHLLTYEEFKDEVPHDTVLLFVFNGNDLTDNMRFQTWQDDPVTHSIELSMTDKLKRRVVRTYTGQLLQRSSKMLSGSEQLSSIPSEEERDVFLQSLASLSAAVKGKGARLLVFALPEAGEFFEDGTPSFREDHAGYGDEVRSLVEQAANDNDFVYLDLKPVLVEAAQERGVPTLSLYGSPDHHLLEESNFVVANAVAKLLDSEGVAEFTPDAQFVDRTSFDPANVVCPAG